MDKIAIASDHAGRELKEDLKQFFARLKVEYVDMGVTSDESADYPDLGVPVARSVSDGSVKSGVLICGTGIGMSIVANKFKGVRAALVNGIYTARLAKEHNDANILVIGAGVVGKPLARAMVKIWMESEFEGGRHKRRIDKISRLEIAGRKEMVEE